MDALDDPRLWDEVPPQTRPVAAVTSRPLRTDMTCEMQDTAVVAVEREAWMAAEDDVGALFERVSTDPSRPSQPSSKRDSERAPQSAVSSKELNVNIYEPIDEYPVQRMSLSCLADLAASAIEEKRSVVYGDAGSSWRMIKLKSVQRAALESQNVDIKKLALERFSTLEEYYDAVKEGEFLDRHPRNSRSRSHPSSRAGSSGFRKPKDDSHNEDRSNRRRSSPRRHDDDHRYRHPQPETTDRDRPGSRVGAELRKRPRSPSPQNHLPSSTVTPHQMPEKRRHASTDISLLAPYTAMPLPPTPSNDSNDAVLTTQELNQLRSRVLRAKLRREDGWEELEREYDQKSARAEERKRQANAIVLPQSLASVEEQPGLMTASSRQRGKHNKAANEDNVDLATMVRQEKMSAAARTGLAGASSNARSLTQRYGGSADAAMAHRIMLDSRFQSNLEYMEDNAEKIASSSRTKSAQQLRQVAIQDFRKHQSILNRCSFCFRDEGTTPPAAPLVSLGHRVYLALTPHREFIPGHCLIVPVQHVASTLDLDDDAWDEIRNFMKCLIRLHHSQDRGCIFTETVVDVDNQRHAAIECFPLSHDLAADASGYFKTAILESDAEWTTHRKLIDTSQGFRNAISSRVAYFHVWFTLNGGYGHIVEDASRFPGYFAREVVGGMLGLEAYLWRRPQTVSTGAEIKERLAKFRSEWDKWDWTKQLGE